MNVHVNVINTHRPCYQQNSGLGRKRYGMLPGGQTRGDNMQDVAVAIVKREVRSDLIYYGLAKGI